MNPSSKRLLKQRKIVNASFRLLNANDFPRLGVDGNLRLYRVLLFLSAVVPALLFFGR